MKITKIEILEIDIPFKLKFKHNSKTRDKTESFFVKITTNEGILSFGEGCPRSYVTRENISSCKDFLHKNLEEILAVRGLKDLQEFISKNNLNISKNPSAWCAIEMALLDILAKEQQITVGKLLDLDAPISDFSVTAVIGIGSYLSTLKKIAKYRLYGFKDFKLKMSGNLKTDLKTLQTMKLFGISSSNIRIDANNIWSTEQECCEYLKQLDQYFWAVEEPLLGKDFEEFKTIYRKINKKIILDESFLKIEDFEKIKNNQEKFLVNLRISKMGGVIRSLNLATKLKDNGFQFILGTHVGETGLLGSTWLLIAERFKEQIYAMEGGYSSHLLEYDPAWPNIKFGRKGILKSRDLNLKNRGLGVEFIVK